MDEPNVTEAINAPMMRYLHSDASITLKPIGNWTIGNIGHLEEPILRLKEQIKKDLSEGAENTNKKKLVFDLSKLGEIDTNGAYLFLQIAKCCDGIFEKIEYTGDHKIAPRLINEVSKFDIDYIDNEPKIKGWDAVSRSFSNALQDGIEEMVNSLSFIGQTIVCLIRAIIRPNHIRWIPTIAIAQSAGLNAIGLVMMLTGFIGVVITFMGAQTLQSFGASVYTVDLLGIAILREFAVIITAIIISGRSASAFAAQIGSMKMGQEIDAMSIIGLNPMEILVIPRVLALLLMLPILVFFAMIAGLVGGAIISTLTLDMSMTMFLTRLQEQVGIKNFWVGMSKAPVFAFIIAIIGCRQGLMVENDVISLGNRTTSAVVQAIMMVIIVEAIFAVIYYELEI